MKNPLWTCSLLIAVFLSSICHANLEPQYEPKVWLSDKEPKSCLARYLYDKVLQKEYSPPTIISHSGSQVNGVIEYGATPGTRHAYRRILEQGGVYTITVSTLKPDMSGEIVVMNFGAKKCSNPSIVVSCNLPQRKEIFTTVVWDASGKCKPLKDYPKTRSLCPVVRDLCETVEKFNAGN